MVAVLVSVAGKVEVLPIVTKPNGSGFGVNVAAAAVAVPVPLSATVCGDGVALSRMVSVPVRAPVAVGVKVTLMTHVPPAATVAPLVHVVVPVTIAKLPEIVTLLKPLSVSGAFPLLVSVTV